MNTTSLGTIAKQSVGWSIGLSVLMLLAGVLAIVIPPAAGIAVVIVVAWLLIFSGTAHLIFAWHTRKTGRFLFELLIGILYILVGVYTLLHRIAGLASLTLVLVFIYLRRGSWNSSCRSDYVRCLVPLGCCWMESLEDVAIEY